MGILVSTCVCLAISLQKILTSLFQEFLLKGHGVYKEIPSEKDFFDEIKSSKRAVVHFYRPTTDRCTIFDKHLEIIAPKYLEARFVKLNAEKAPFLCERLNIRVIPTLLLIVDGQTKVVRWSSTLKLTKNVDLGKSCWF